MHIRITKDARYDNSYYRELYFLTGTETFAKKPKFGKLLRELYRRPYGVIKISPLVFCRISVTASLLRLGALLRDNLQMGAFSCHRCMFLLACIDQ